MVHIDNMRHIWECGITKIDSPNANVNYKSIGDVSIINTRNSFMIPNGNSLGNYIPFYVKSCNSSQIIYAGESAGYYRF